MDQDPAAILPASPLRRTSRVRQLLLLVVAVAATIAITRFIGRIDWSSVGTALAHLSWWQPLVLLMLLCVRQVTNAAPLAFFVPNTSFYRATVNDMGAMTLAAFAPPPSDIALRVAMFNSWGIKTSTALAGTAMNSVCFFIARFSAPMLGFVVVVATGGEVGLRWLDLISLAIAATLIVGIRLIVRTDSWARWVGCTAGSVVHRVRRSVDPQVWAEACAQFRGDIAARFPYGFWRSLVSLLVMLTTDMAIMLLCLRFVGLSGTEISVTDVAIAFLFAYPLTMFPMSGIGVVDMVALASLVAAGGIAVQEPAIAGLIIWRVFTVAGPLLLGLGAVVLWRRSLRAPDGSRSSSS